MDDPAEQRFLIEAIIFLAAALVAVPLFRKLRLGSILGYLAAGTIVGPYGLGLLFNVDSVLHTAELGVVLLLFVIGLELKLSRLWSMRRDIFGLGLTQVVLTGLVLASIAIMFGYSYPMGLIGGFALALSSTAFTVQLLRERGDLNTPYGHRAFAILLFQDISIVPLLAMIPLLGMRGAEGSDFDFEAIALAAAVLVAIVVVGRFALNPLFRILAATGAQEIMTAAALLVVIGAAVAMAEVGLSMALGAFLAGVMLAESSYRHQLEADIEPFRGLLLGLFFIAVGMSVNWPLVLEDWEQVLVLMAVFMSVKMIAVYGLARAFGSSSADAARVAVVLPQGGEFAFVLFATALAGGILDRDTANLLIAGVTLSMALMPAIVAVHDALTRSRGEASADHPEEVFDGNDRRVILLGFGRFGQIVAGMLQEWGVEVTAIDNAPERIRSAASFGYKVYFGDAQRVSVLRAAGAEEARLIVLCVDSRTVMNKAIDRIRANFPQAAIFCRAQDRTHAIELMDHDVDFQVRETLESAILLGREALIVLGATPDEAEDCEDEFRQHDRERLMLQRVDGLHAGMESMPQRKPAAPTEATSA